MPHAPADHDPDAAAAAATYRSTGNPVTPRSRDEVSRLLDGPKSAEPGLVDAMRWRPDDGALVEHVGYHAVVGRPVSRTRSRSAARVRTWTIRTKI